MRFVICGRKRIEYGKLSPMCVYISKRGCITSAAEKLWVGKTLDDAKKEVDYWRINSPSYRWRIEQLKLGMSISKAVLCATEIEA